MKDDRPIAEDYLAVERLDGARDAMDAWAKRLSSEAERQIRRQARSSAGRAPERGGDAMKAQDLAKRRADQLAQQRHRQGHRSPATEAEDALILLAWEAGELTEGQAATALGVDRLGARLRRENGIGRGAALAAALLRGKVAP